MFLIEIQLGHTRGAVGAGAVVRSEAAIAGIPEYTLVLHEEKRTPWADAGPMLYLSRNVHMG